MSYSLNSLIKGGYTGDHIGDYYTGVIQGDTRSLDYSSSDAKSAEAPTGAGKTTIVPLALLESQRVDGKAFCAWLRASAKKFGVLEPA